MTFTEEQLQAINSIDSNSQIIACAGSGKTTTIVAKILQILEMKELTPQNIVAITYTEKAAASLKQKIYNQYEKKFGNVQGLADMYIGTIHGYCLYILQEYTKEYKNFEILNDVQTRLFIKQKQDVNGLADAIYHSQSGDAYPLIYNRMSNEKLRDAIFAYKAFLDIVREHGVEKINNNNLSDYINKYEKSLIDNKYFDFTSILVTALSFLEKGAFNDYIENQVKYMIIDEYQDVNDTQEHIIKYFHDHGTLICVVGDDDQTIYHWRGSNLKYIREFQHRYDNVDRIDLDINFRSSHGITEVAKQVIENNNTRLTKSMRSNNSQDYNDGDILALDFESKDNEIEFIVSKIHQLIGTKYIKNGITYGLDLDDMVILVSSVKRIPELIHRLQTEKIDVLVEGTQELFKTDEIYLLSETFNLLFEIDKEETEKKDHSAFLSEIKIDSQLISEWARLFDIEIILIEKALKSFIKFYLTKDSYEYTIQGNLKKLFADLRLFDLELSDRVLYNLGEFTIIINDFEKINLLLTPWFKLRAFRSFLLDDAPSIYPEGWLSPNFKTIRCLRIMTFHQAKGLEYPVVFMPFLTKYAIFPLRKPGGISAWGIINDANIQIQYENDPESIRRLFYVGITRSEKFLFMTRSKVPYAEGRRQYNEPAQPYVEAKNSNYVKQDDYLSIDYPKSPEKKFSKDEIITLNFSLLKDLFDCPFKFKMLNVFGFTQPLNIRMGYGKSMHNMLDYVHKNYNKIDLSNDSVVKKIVDDFLYLPYGSKILKESMREKALKHLFAYIRNNKKKFEHILFSEKAIDYAINEYLFINGRIDLIRDDINHTTTIVDFKSSSDVLSKDQIKNQLMTYVLGYENLTGDNVDYIESYDINKTNPTIISISNQDKDDFKKKLIKCQEMIKSEEYPRITSIDKQKDSNYCKNIDCVLCDTCNMKNDN